MLFASIYTYRNGLTEKTQQRLANLFVKWKTPKGYTFKAHYAFADGSGGIALIEAESAAALYEGAVPWNPFIEIRNVPVVEIESAVPISIKAMAWRDAVKA